jgi:hypothetical protein
VLLATLLAALPTLAGSGLPVTLVALVLALLARLTVLLAVLLVRLVFVAHWVILPFVPARACADSAPEEQ